MGDDGKENGNYMNYRVIQGFIGISGYIYIYICIGITWG